MHELLDPSKNPVTYAVPFFVLTVLIELAALKWLDHDDNVTGYALKDARASMSMGAISLFFSLLLKIGSFFVYSALYLWVAPFHLATNTWWYWIALLIAQDLTFYGTHRFMHRARVGWAAHQAHHSSEYMNYGTALRQKWNPWFEGIFWLPLPLLGFAPWTIYVAFGFNLIFQFFTHTELIDKLPRPIELIFNTPSHHRVHHGSDPEYLDKNYAGILIIWDRMFGTFQAEMHRPKYGLTKPKDTYNIIKLQYGDYVELWRDLKNADSWQTRLGYVFRPPGWEPHRSIPDAELRGGVRVPPALRTTSLVD